MNFCVLGCGRVELKIICVEIVISFDDDKWVEVVEYGVFLEM